MTEENDSNSYAGGAPTTAAAATTTTTQATDSGNRGKNRNKDKYNSAVHFGSNDKEFEGAQPSIGGILGLKTERLQHKVTFEIFTEKLKTFILSDFKNPKDVLPTLRLVDPLIGFKARNAPAALSDQEKGEEIEQQMQSMRIKLYINREQAVKGNMDKLYGVIIGQCSDAVLSVLGNDIDYIAKDEECDVIWLLRKLKTITSGLDSKSNKRSNLHDAL